MTGEHGIVEHRLREWLNSAVAGRDGPLFADDAIARLHRVANGHWLRGLTAGPR